MKRVLLTRGVDRGRLYVLAVGRGAIGVRLIDLTAAPTRPASDRAVLVARPRTLGEVADALAVVEALRRSPL